MLSKYLINDIMRIDLIDVIEAIKQKPVEKSFANMSKKYMLHANSAN